MNRRIDDLCSHEGIPCRFCGEGLIGVCDKCERKIEEGETRATGEGGTYCSDCLKRD